MLSQCLFPSSLAALIRAEVKYLSEQNRTGDSQSGLPSAPLWRWSGELKVCVSMCWAVKLDIINPALSRRTSCQEAAAANRPGLLPLPVKHETTESGCGGLGHMVVKRVWSLNVETAEKPKAPIKICSCVFARRGWSFLGVKERGGVDLLANRVKVEEDFCNSCSFYLRRNVIKISSHYVCVWLCGVWSVLNRMFVKCFSENSSGCNLGWFDYLCIWARWLVLSPKALNVHKAHDGSRLC